jgi:diguanylate cyclase (GGDEF)-like protein
MRNLDRFFRRTPRPVTLAISILLVAAVSYVDRVTGYELSFSIFYLIPISLTAWYVGRTTGQAMSVISALAWLAVDVASGRDYSSAFVPFWNAAVRLGFFVLVAALLASLRRHLRLEESLARVDGLTGVMTGRSFQQSAAEVIGLASRTESPFSLIYVDLDDFKKVNDTRGHAEGDRALKAVATALMQSVRRTDLIGRLGGDEFAVLLPDTDDAGAREVIEKIRSNLASTAADSGWPIGASIGAAVYLTPSEDTEEAIARADDLMYRAKASGKNRTVYFEVRGAWTSPELRRETPAASPGPAEPDISRR